jgi:hypothetical protein
MGTKSVAEPMDWHHRCDIPACNCGRCHQCGQEMPEPNRRFAQPSTNERLRHLLAVALDPSEDEDHEWCDEDGNAMHRFDRGAFEADVRAALASKDPT